MPPEELQPDNVELDALIEQGQETNEKLGSIDVNSEAQVINQKETTEAVRDLETPLEVIAQNTKPKDVQRIEFVGPQITAIKGEKGDKGDKGDRGERGEKGDQGAPLTWAQLTPQQKAAIKGEKGDTGEPGADGRDGRDGRDGANGADGAQGPEGRPGRDGKPSKTPLKGKDYFTAKDKAAFKEEIGDDLQRQVQRQIASKTYSVSELEGMAGATAGQVPTKQEDGSWAPETPAAGGGSGTLAIKVVSGTINGSNTAFTIASTFSGKSWIRLNTTVLLQDVDYTVSGVNITYNSAPPAGLSGKPHHLICAG